MHVSVYILWLFQESRDVLRRLGVAVGHLVQFWIIMGPKYHLQYHFHIEGSPENIERVYFFVYFKK